MGNLISPEDYLFEHSVDLIPLNGENYVYISNFWYSMNVANLKRNGIKSILYLGDFAKSTKLLNEYRAAGITHHFIRIGDYPWSNIYPHLDFIYNYISDRLREGPVLIHCLQGKSRSVSSLAYYLVRSGMFNTFDEALAYIKQYRIQAAPNRMFVKQIKRKIWEDRNR